VTATTVFNGAEKLEDFSKLAAASLVLLGCMLVL
jgi:hypothetical protein